jgi:hypothetical protein
VDMVTHRSELDGKFSDDATGGMEVPATAVHNQKAQNFLTSITSFSISRYWKCSVPKG